MNERWAKGHVRLASAYIALGGHSNDACNALQRALQLDPRYPQAREMLVRELRRGHGGAVAATTTTTTTVDSEASTVTERRSHPQGSLSPSEGGTNDTNVINDHASSTRATTERFPDTDDFRPLPSAPPEDYDDSRRRPHPPFQHPQPAARETGEEDPARPGQHTPVYNPYRRDQPPHQGPQRQEPHVPLDDDTVTLYDRLLVHIQRARTWYFSQSEEIRSLLLVLVGLICLYVAFGGRFGLERWGNQPAQRRRGNYHSGNAYDQYYKEQRRSSHGDTQRGNYYDRYSASQQQREKDEYYSMGRSRESRRGGSLSSLWSSLHMPNLFDGSFQSMAILAGIAYMCHRNGINLMQVMMLLNMANGGGMGRRRGFGGHVFRYGGGWMGGGLGGLGGRPRPRW